MKILITGAGGTLGGDLQRVFSSAGHELILTDRDTLDITDREAVFQFIREWQPEVIINSAAYNFVDNVEEDAHYPVALAVNAHGPRNLAEAAKEMAIPFVHYSTDYVFPGDKPEGYTEDDPTGPISRYGETKEAGEKMVQEVGGEYYICRLSKIFGVPGESDNSKESFVALMLRLAAKLPEMKIVHEEVGSPSYTRDIAETTLQLLHTRPGKGIFHIVNEGSGVTWYEFAEEIFDLAGVETPRTPVPSAEFPKPAARPKFAALRNTKLPPLRERTDALREFMKDSGLTE